MNFKLVKNELLPALVQIIDENGIVRKEITICETTQLDLSQLSKGLYHILVKDNLRQFTKTIKL
jgi:hypothetical protein